MAITFILNDEAVNDQTAGLQTADGADGFTDTDVAYTSLSAAFRTYLETTLGLNPAFPTNVGVATKTNSVTVNATSGSQLAGTTFTDSNGGALNGDDSLLNTADGKDILLFADGNDTVIGRYDSDGNGSADAIAFVIFKQDVVNAGATSDQVTFHIVTYVPIFHNNSTDPDDAVDLGNTLKLAASETLNFGFAGAPSGSNLFMTFGDPNSTQIVVIGKNPLNQSQGGNITTKDVLNISQAGSTTSFGVNGNQINPNEGAFITYVTGADTNFLVPNLDQNEADVEANIAFTNVVNATGASFTVNQTNPGVGPVTVKITAFTTAAEPGVNFVDGLTNDTQVNITSASVTDFVVKTGNTQFTPVATVNADGTLTITGLSTGDKVTWTTTSTHDRVLIENISNADTDATNDNNTFDIGGFGIVTSSGSSTFVGQQIVIEDDGPTAGIVQGAPTVAHDETAGNQGDADDTTAAGVISLFAGVSNVSTDLSPTGYAQDASAVVSSTGSSTGTDGGTIAFSLDVSASGVDSGLDTTAGVSIFLFKEGNLVVGRIGGAGGQAAFAVAINSTTGVVSVAQYASIHHPTPGGSYDESVSITDSALRAVVTVTDRDNDTATSSTGIGDAVQFQDDGPTAAIVQLAATVTHDETAGNDADADDTTAAGVVSLFAGVANVSTDLSPAGYAQDPNAVVSSTGSSLGADQEGGTTAFSLAVSAAGVDSGLDTTAGVSIFLFKEGNLVVGRIGGAAGAAAFAVAINSTTGVVSVAQYASILHPTPGGSYDESVNITDGALLAVVTVTDGDGDTATSSTGIGDAVVFQDDGPTIAVADAAAGGDYDSGAHGTWTHDPGADGFNLLSVTLDSYEIDANGTVPSGASLTQTGAYSFTGSITDDFNGDNVDDTVNFTLTFDPVANTYALAVTQLPPTIENFDTSEGSLKAGGPDAVQTLQFPPDGPSHDVIFFGAVPTAPLENGSVGSDPNDIEDLVQPDPDLTEAQLEALSATSLINSSFKMNVSTSGIGINNNNLDGVSGGTPAFPNTTITSGDESFVVNPEQDVDKVTVYIDNSVGGYTPATEDLYYIAYYTDGTVSGPIEVTLPMLNDAPRHDPLIPDVAEGGKYFVIDGGSKQIEAIQLTMGVGTVKIPVIQFSIEQPINPDPLDLDFTAHLSDGDNDSASDTFTIHLDVADGIV
ncbi:MULTISPECIES: DUF5801 repeats-in-toxin domain-containing protein [unclassified Mesorhizobium]|uniref:DUF5801 repeats-in-toxin domain-containing protein n=2 Tax=Mesorhizobium TaxID=68287 RepID=UPI000BAF1DF0|nr:MULTISPECIES: DUF5801 repeats-in-toxin domain-containing protein [unclassified Mesorhizobium]TGT59894.1 hypothetical protein EN813_025225 [Mesorhizobium sp. M00.F.Ca.ET.170.01.1.1]AZO08050.1 hypothetical protein EJ074_02125 [Mesorhizobium sp. M3A.F.Ca.ET.080.04.2.1]PBB87001.1 hypothetical protein CK216_08495 [Mesorhizobium sp. WSM3876]RWB70327.1 MAG: hypothetical protein EOQ49_18475 [Mesorhizobium sp.]RWB91391.1 MAG: hypothetical protein EOQ52_08205 [Mesorhizobium sp.]